MNEIQAQIPAEGILLQSDWGDSKLYKISCECGCQSEHNLHIEAEESGLIWARIYARVKTNYWTELWPKRYDIDNDLLQRLDWWVKGLVNGLAIRLKLTWMIWTRGYLECEQDIALTQQQAVNYSATLKSAVEQVESFKKSQL